MGDSNSNENVMEGQIKINTDQYILVIHYKYLVQAYKAYSINFSFSSPFKMALNNLFISKPKMRYFI